MTDTASADPRALFPTLQALVQAGGAAAALRCMRDLFPAQHELESARALRQRAVLMMAQCSDLRADRQSARRDLADLKRIQTDLDTRTLDFIREAERVSRAGATPPQLLARVHITAEQALSELKAGAVGETIREAALSIFISYRRSDSKNIVGFIAKRLQERFGDDNIFWDIDSIPPGVDFRAYVVKRISQCKACLVVIGPDWLRATNADGSRRIDDEDDLVRVEVESALRLNIPVAPVLVEDARLPFAHDLPPSLAPLVARHGMNIRPPPDFDIDIDRLMNRLADRLG